MPEKEPALRWEEIKEFGDHWVAHWPVRGDYTRGRMGGAQLRVSPHFPDPQLSELEQLSLAGHYEWRVAQNGDRTRQGTSRTRSQAMVAAEAVVPGAKGKRREVH